MIMPVAVVVTMAMCMALPMGVIMAVARDSPLKLLGVRMLVIVVLIFLVQLFRKI